MPYLSIFPLVNAIFKDCHVNHISTVIYFSLVNAILFNFSLVITRPGTKYSEKYSNTLQLLSLINDYNYIAITGRLKCNHYNYNCFRNVMTTITTTLENFSTVLTK